MHPGVTGENLKEFPKSLRLGRRQEESKKRKGGQESLAVLMVVITEFFSLERPTSTTWSTPIPLHC